MIKVRKTILENGVRVTKTFETTVGRVMFNEVVPEEMGYINDVLTKKSLRDIIGEVFKKCGVPKTAKFLDKYKELGFKMKLKEVYPSISMMLLFQKKKKNSLIMQPIK